MQSWLVLFSVAALVATGVCYWLYRSNKDETVRFSRKRDSSREQSATEHATYVTKAENTQKSARVFGVLWKVCLGLFVFGVLAVFGWNWAWDWGVHYGIVPPRPVR